MTETLHNTRARLAKHVRSFKFDPIALKATPKHYAKIGSTLPNVQYKFSLSWPWVKAKKVSFKRSASDSCEKVRRSTHLVENFSCRLLLVAIAFLRFPLPFLPLFPPIKKEKNNGQVNRKNTSKQKSRYENFW